MTSIFVDQSRLTLENVGTRIQADDTLSPERRAAIRSAISTLSRIMDTSPAMVPADLNFIRRKLERISPAAAGVKEKRFSTVKSQVLFALRHLGLVGKGTYLTPMVGQWKPLWKRLPNKYARTAFSRFFRYCSARGLGPDDVDDAVAREFLEALTEESFIKNPRVTHQNLCRIWNAMVGVVRGWPVGRLTVPRYAEHYIKPPDTFPASFWHDVEAWLSNQAHDDLLNLNAPPTAEAANVEAVSL